MAALAGGIENIVLPNISPDEVWKAMKLQGGDGVSRLSWRSGLLEWESQMRILDRLVSGLYIGKKCKVAQRHFRDTRQAKNMKPNQLLTTLFSSKFRYFEHRLLFPGRERRGQIHVQISISRFLGRRFVNTDANLIRCAFRKKVMILSRPKRSFALERDMRALEKVRRVTTILDSDTFRDQLERIVETQAQRGPTLQPQPRTRRERDVDEKYERIATATASPAPSRVLPTSRPIDDLLALDVMRIGAKERADRCKLACVCRLVDFFGWSRLVYNHVTVGRVSFCVCFRAIGCCFR